MHSLPNDAMLFWVLNLVQEEPKLEEIYPLCINIKHMYRIYSLKYIIEIRAIYWND